MQNVRGFSKKHFFKDYLKYFHSEFSRHSAGSPLKIPLGFIPKISSRDRSRNSITNYSRDSTIQLGILQEIILWVLIGVAGEILARAQEGILEESSGGIPYKNPRNSIHAFQLRSLYFFQRSIYDEDCVDETHISFIYTVKSLPVHSWNDIYRKPCRDFSEAILGEIPEEKAGEISAGIPVKICIEKSL